VEAYDPISKYREVGFSIYFGTPNSIKMIDLKGHFSSALINDAFLGLDTKKGPFFAIEPSRHGMLVNLNWIY